MAIPSDFRLYRLYNDTKSKKNPLNVLIFDWDFSSGDRCDLSYFIRPYAQEMLGTIVSTHTPGSLFTGDEKKGHYYIKKGFEGSMYVYYNYYLYDGKSYKQISDQWMQSFLQTPVEVDGKNNETTLLVDKSTL